MYSIRMHKKNESVYLKIIKEEINLLTPLYIEFQEAKDFVCYMRWFVISETLSMLDFIKCITR